MVKMTVFGASKWPKLISRKIWVAEKSWKFHIVYIYVKNTVYSMYRDFFVQTFCEMNFGVLKLPFFAIKEMGTDLCEFAEISGFEKCKNS